MKTTISTASLLLGGVCAIALTAPAFAQAPQVRSFDIPGGELRQALDAYVRQSGAQLIYRTEDVRGTKTRGVAGALPPEEALKRVLAGTPFVVKRDASGAVAVVAAPNDADLRVRPVATSAETVAGSAAAYIAQPVTPSAAPATVEEVMVTGSRIIRNGYEAPTPTTVIGAADIQARAPANIADYVNQLPAMGTATARARRLMFANATGGANQLSARGLGVTRTLVLLDGRRVVGLGHVAGRGRQPAAAEPGAAGRCGDGRRLGGLRLRRRGRRRQLHPRHQLHRPEGLGERRRHSGPSDGETFSGDLAFGAKFAGRQGPHPAERLLLRRPWHRFAAEPQLVPAGLPPADQPDWTATNGQPGQIVRNDAGYTSTPGGVIASGPLKGTNFLPGGQIGQFVFGPIQQGQVQAGGTVEDTAYQWPLLPDEKHWSTYGRLSYEITDNLTAIAEYSYSGSDTVNWSAVYNRQGASAITVSRQNPFLPVATQQAMDRPASARFQMNRLFYDMVNEPGSHIGASGLLPPPGSLPRRARRQVPRDRQVAGLLPARPQQRLVHPRQQPDPHPLQPGHRRHRQPGDRRLAGIAAGAPICRSTLTAPTNGCVPMNIFGDGSLGKASVAWVTGAARGCAPARTWTSTRTSGRSTPSTSPSRPGPVRSRSPRATNTARSPSPRRPTPRRSPRCGTSATTRPARANITSRSSSARSWCRC
jgi:iron complex outermembrane receptor protein